MKRRLGIRVMTVMLGCLLLWGSSVYNAVAKEPLTEKKVYVYHQHVGSKEEQGGCFTRPVYHEHTGDEVSGGGCHSTAVYHEHFGSESESGDCYSIPVFHEHKGDGSAESGCYKAAYHQHSGGCYRDVSSEERGCYVENWWNTTEDDWTDKNGNVYDYKVYEMSCGQTVRGTNPSHKHSELNCQRGSEITGYVIGCGKNESTIDAYQLSCERTADMIDCYILSCNKTNQDIDEYAVNCGKDEETPYGVMTVSASDTGNQTVVLSAAFEDLTGGELVADEAGYVWYDHAGNELGNGPQIEVSENGIYRATLLLSKEGITPNSLCAEVAVNSIVKPSVKEETGNKDDQTGDDSEQENNQINNLTPAPTTTPTVSPTPTNTPEPVMQEQDINNGSTLSTNRARYVVETEDKTESSPTPSRTPEMKKKTVVVKPKERQSEPEVIPQIQMQESPQPAFFSSPAVKVITLTIGIMVVILACMMILYALRRSVAVYNDDGNGNLAYLGRSLIFSEEEGYVIVITEKMIEKSETNKYCIKPDFFLIGRKEEEVIVERGQKRVSAMLCKEMNIII